MMSHLWDINVHFLVRAPPEANSGICYPADRQARVYWQGTDPRSEQVHFSEPGTARIPGDCLGQVDRKVRVEIFLFVCPQGTQIKKYYPVLDADTEQRISSADQGVELNAAAPQMQLVRRGPPLGCRPSCQASFVITKCSLLHCILTNVSS